MPAERERASQQLLELGFFGELLQPQLEIGERRVPVGPGLHGVAEQLPGAPDLEAPVAPVAAEVFGPERDQLGPERRVQRPHHLLKEREPRDERRGVGAGRERLMDRGARAVQPA